MPKLNYLNETFWVVLKQFENLESRWGLTLTIFADFCQQALYHCKLVDLFADGVDGIYAGVIFSPIFYDSKSMIFLLYCTLAHQKIVYVTVWNAQISSYFIHSEIFFNLGSFLSKNLERFFTQNRKKKFKLECLFIFSGGNCTLNLRSF